MPAAIDQILRAVRAHDGSDLHLMVGLPPRARVSGTLITLTEFPAVTAEHMEKLLHEICPPVRWEFFQKNHDLDFAYEIAGLARFRVNYLQNAWGMGAVFRQIPSKILSFDDLQLPESIKKLCTLREGLVLVTGPTGSGKSTTLAAMIDYINSTSRRNIVTIEEPIEFVHTNKQSIIAHREVGEHTESFAAAIRGAMRSDPDILLVGEMRQLDTMRLALGCAAMGILVFATLHTNNAPKTIDRIIDAFPADEQNQARVLLAGGLRGIVSQLLCKKISGGRVAVHEILLPHDALGGTIRSGNIAAIRNIIEGSQNEGMISMDVSLRKQFEAGVITAREAYMKATDKTLFERHLGPDTTVHN
ncbi:type IV pilus twitching motility protein PilT [Rariglobus hedericola]|uniref:PilT/PilU family type 4a pilus ATPase n=1 Tax=Rariglobus hedericola TaxID=2597822 RepID=A0A556QKR2_9BACT|nr:PilT/PilU family type 4a pilus ATPase [Rariglobus hedericola]TSJ77218.1 PilT/PilU family type 4a pilus ATPase [Rariglobus hedericola]